MVIQKKTCDGDDFNIIFGIWMILGRIIREVKKVSLIQKPKLNATGFTISHDNA